MNKREMGVVTIERERFVVYIFEAKERHFFYLKKTKNCAGAASLNGGSSFDGGLDGLLGPCYSPCYSADIEGLESGDDGLLVDNSSTCSSTTQAAPCSSAAGKLGAAALPSPYLFLKKK